MADNESSIKRILPHDNDAERGLIGSMMMDPDAISDVSGFLVKEDFYNIQYGLLFDAMCSIFNEGKQVDQITLSEKLRQMGAPEEIYKLEYLSDILAGQQTSAFVMNYAGIVRDKATLRKMIKASDNIAMNCYEGKDTTENILGDAEDSIFKLVQDRNGSREFTPMNEVVVNVINEIEDAAKNKGRVTGIPTGFIDLDLKLAGLHGGELILIAARPAMGKTAFELSIVHHVAVKENVPVAVFSLEMSKESLTQRLLAIDAMVDSQNIRTGELSDDDWDKIIESSDSIAAAPIFIDDDSDLTISKMRSKCRKLKQTKNIGLIVIDYLQLMSSQGNVESRQQFISEVSRAMKGIARELKVPVIALSQLNRAVDSRPDHRPVLADLRESGAIEQDSDVVMFIYRDEYYNPETERPGIAEIIVAKQRSGSTGPVDLAWLGQYTKFANLVR